MPLFIPVSATKSAIRLRMRISEKNKDSLAKSMNFNSIWLKNRLYYSQIEQFSFDLAIECLVDTFLFHPFNYPLELITEVSHVVQVRAAQKLQKQHALKGQKLLAQGIALGMMAISKAPCKGKSFVNCLVLESFCPFRATNLRP